MGHTLICELPEHKEFMVTKDIFDLPSVGGTGRNVPTQFSVGSDYWSQVDFDHDIFLCFMYVLPNKNRDEKKIMYKLGQP